MTTPTIIASWLEGVTYTLTLSIPNPSPWQVLDTAMRAASKQWPDEHDLSILRVSIWQPWKGENPEWEPRRSHQKEQLKEWGIESYG